MEDRLISWWTAALAFEKGFNEHCRFMYWHDDILHEIGNYNQTNRQENTPHYSAPTQSLLQKWLREVHNIYVSSYPAIAIGWPEPSFYQPHINNCCIDGRGKDKYKTFEEALEIGLQEGLKQIQL